MLRFVCTDQTPQSLKILDGKTGEDLTEALLCAQLDILLSMRPDESNRARMVVYAAGVDVLVDRVELAVKHPDAPEGGAFLERDLADFRGELETVKRDVRLLDEHLRTLGRSLDANVVILQRLVETLRDQAPGAENPAGQGQTETRVG